MSYSLTQEATQAIAVLLKDGGEASIVLVRPRQAEALAATLTVEPDAKHIRATLRCKSALHSLRLYRSGSANQQHLAEFVEQIANGVADTTESAPMAGVFDRMLATNPAAQQLPFALTPEEEASLRHLVRLGGTRHLACGVSITVHNTLQSEQRDALVTTPAGTQHLHAGTPGELYVVATEHIESTLNAA